MRWIASFGGGDGWFSWPKRGPEGAPRSACPGRIRHRICRRTDRCRSAPRTRHHQPVEHHGGPLLRHLGLDRVRSRGRPAGCNRTGHMEHEQQPARDHHVLHRGIGNQLDTEAHPAAQRSRRRDLHDERARRSSQRGDRRHHHHRHGQPETTHTHRNVHRTEQGLRRDHECNNRHEQSRHRRRRHSRAGRCVTHTDRPVREPERGNEQDGHHLRVLEPLRSRPGQLHAVRGRCADGHREHHAEGDHDHTAGVHEDLRRRHRRHSDRRPDPQRSGQWGHGERQWLTHLFIRHQIGRLRKDGHRELVVRTFWLEFGELFALPTDDDRLDHPTVPRSDMVHQQPCVRRDHGGNGHSVK